ncbi:MAG: ABC transporter permease [Oscillospiraceae bacterium]|nr:ABC transporter permease [Oscillospiraceae bacterium]
MLENIALSIQGVWSHKLRSFLTMLGIIIGIASIITIVSTIKGTNEQIKSNLIGAGNNVVTVKLKQDGSDVDLQYSSLPQGVTPATEETRQALDTLDGVAETSLYRCRTWTDGVFYQNTAFNGNLYGVDSHYFSVNGYGVNYGRGFVEEDFTGARKVAVLDTKAANTMFEGQDPIGQTVEILTEPFTVVGVVSTSSSAAPTINSMSDYQMYMDTSAGTIFIPTDCWSIVYRYDEPQYAAVCATSTDEMTAAGNNVAKSLNETQISGDTYSYEADNLLEQASELQELSNSTNKQLIWIAGISLLVGGIGVMNIMLVSVTERTREIGLKKAIGARRKRIARQFLTEAAVLTSLGGLLGVGCGVGLAYMLSSVMGTAVAISVPACVVAVVFSVAIGLIFGLVPAVKASKLNPIDALRRE